MFHDSKRPVTSRHTMEGEKKKFVRWFSLCDSPCCCCCIVLLLLQVPRTPPLNFQEPLLICFDFWFCFYWSAYIHTCSLVLFQKFVRWFSLCRLVAYCCSFSPSWIFSNGCSFILYFALFFFGSPYIHRSVYIVFVCFLFFFQFPWNLVGGGGILRSWWRGLRVFSADLISRFVNDFDSERSLSSEPLKPLRVESPSSAVKRGWEKGSRGLWKVGRSLRLGSSRVYSEDLQVPSKMKILDPRSNFCQQWNKFFVITCLVAIFVDPLFYYLPVVYGSRGNGTCITISKRLAISVTVFRTTTDILYLIHMALQFRTAFVAPSSTTFGRGELVVDPHLIAIRYLKKDFWLDFVAVLPLPQVLPISQQWLWLPISFLL